jgi:hypothetical protein
MHGSQDLLKRFVSSFAPCSQTTGIKTSSLEGGLTPSLKPYPTAQETVATSLDTLTRQRSQVLLIVDSRKIGLPNVVEIETIRQSIVGSKYCIIIIWRTSSACTPTSGSSVDHGVRVETTGKHRNRAAGRGCHDAACSASYLVRISLGRNIAGLPTSRK